MPAHTVKILLLLATLLFQPIGKAASDGRQSNSITVFGDDSPPEGVVHTIELPANPDIPERPANIEKPVRPEKVEKPERPDKPERPEKPDVPDRPGRG